MKRVFETSPLYNYSQNLNYVPFRQKEQFLSPQFSAVSKRSTISFRSPCSKNKNKFSLKEIKHIFPNYDCRPQNQQTDLPICQVGVPLVGVNEQVKSNYVQAQQNISISQKLQQSKLEESSSLATDLYQDQKNIEVFSQHQYCQEPEPAQLQNSQKAANQTSIIQAPSKEQVNEVPIKIEQRAIQEPGPKEWTNETQSRTQIVNESQTKIIEDIIQQAQLKDQINQTPSKIKGIIKTPDSTNISQLSMEPKRVTFFIPPEQKLPEEESAIPSADVKPKDDKFTNILKNLKLKNRNPFNKGKKETKEESGGSRLLMRFKKK